MSNKSKVNSSDNEQSPEVNAVSLSETEINGENVTDLGGATAAVNIAAEANKAADNIESEDAEADARADADAYADDDAYAYDDADADAYDDADANADDNSDSDSSDDDWDEAYYQDPKVLTLKIAELEERLSNLEALLNSTVKKSKKAKKVKCKCKGKKVDISKCKCKRKKAEKK